MRGHAKRRKSAGYRARAVRIMMAFLGAPLLVSSFVASAAHADNFTASQRDAIVAILRDALRNDSSILRDALESLQSSQAEQDALTTKKLIAARHDMLFDKNGPGAGSADPSVTIVEFFDTRCPYCRQIDPMLTSWLAHGPPMRIIYKDIPILGPASVLGSKALLAAQRQGGYNSLRQAIMQSPPDLTEASLQTLVTALGLDWPRLRADMQDPAIQRSIDTNLGLARDFGFEGTPAFIVGDRLVVGSDVTELQSAISAARPR
jgi:protein-disulfide isomerase